MKTILSLGVLYFGLRIVDCIASYYMSDMGHVMGAKIETDMRRDAYNHLQKLSNTYYNNTKVGQIMGRITNDLFDVCLLYTSGFYANLYNSQFAV